MLPQSLDEFWYKIVHHARVCPEWVDKDDAQQHKCVSPYACAPATVKCACGGVGGSGVGGDGVVGGEGGGEAQVKEEELRACVRVYVLVYSV